MKMSVVGLGALALVSAQPALAFRPCLRVGEIYNWNALNDRTLVVEDDFHKKFKLQLIGVCSNLKFHEALAFRSIGGLAISCLEPGDQVIERDFATGPERCSITKIDAYTPDMEKADKAAAQAAKDQRSSY
jgi:hypothetical protein